MGGREVIRGHCRWWWSVIAAWTELRAVRALWAAERVGEIESWRVGDSPGQDITKLGLFLAVQ